MPLPDTLYWSPEDYLVVKNTQEVLGRAAMYNKGTCGFVESTSVFYRNLYNYSAAYSSFRNKEFLTVEAVKAAVEQQYDIQRQREIEYKKRQEIKSKVKEEKKGFIAWITKLLNLK